MAREVRTERRVRDIDWPGELTLATQADKEHNKQLQAIITEYYLAS